MPGSKVDGNRNALGRLASGKMEVAEATETVRAFRHKLGTRKLNIRMTAAKPLEARAKPNGVQE